MCISPTASEASHLWMCHFLCGLWRAASLCSRWSLDLFILFSWMSCVSSDPQCLLTNGKLPLWAKRLVSLRGSGTLRG